MEHTRKNKENILTGSAGEYFVAAELSRRGIVAALTMSGTDAFDILAVNQSGKSYSIQVKTTQHTKTSWLLGKKDETSKADFYVFVNLNGKELPEYYIVPANIVSDTISKEHQHWLKSPGLRGQEHKDTPMRVFRIQERDPRYYNHWEPFCGNSE